MVLIAFALFSCVDTSAKWLASMAIPVFQVAFFRYAGHFVVTSLQAAGNSFKQVHVSKDVAPLVLLRGGLLAASTVCNFIAIPHLPLTTIATILFSAPVFVCALSGPMLGEKVGPWRWGAILIGFLGVVVALRPDSGFHWAMIFSLGASLNFALYSLMSRKLSKTVPVASLQFYSGLVGTVVLAPVAWYYWVWPDTVWQWSLLIGVGLFAWFGHELYTRAHGFAPASALTPFSYVLFLYMCFWGWLIFDQLPDGKTIAAAAMMVCAGITIWWRETGANR